MGANFVDFVAGGTEARVRKVFAEAQEQSWYESGHSYSGEIGMASGIEFPKVEPFASEKAAREWLEDHCEKWEAALAVRIPSAGRKGHRHWWLIGAWCAS